MAKALIIVDMQKSFFKAEALKRRQSKLVEACNRLIDTAIGCGSTLITTRTEHQSDRSTWTLNMLDDGDGFLLAGEGDAAYVDGLNVEKAYEIIKTRDSAFWQTSLLTYLRQNNIDSIVLAGISTHKCITQTAVDAYNANIQVELAVDAIASDQPAMHELFLEFLQREYRMPQRRVDDINWGIDKE